MKSFRVRVRAQAHTKSRVYLNRTTSPGAKLHVKASTEDVIRATNTGDNTILYIGADSSGAGDGLLELRTAGGTRTLIHSDGNTYFMGGNVGIGTNNPGAPLHLYRTTAVNPQFIIENTAAPYRSAKFYFDTGSASGYGTANGALNIINAGASGDIGLRAATSGDVQFILKGSGNVGIGTTAPSYPLHVEATTGSYIKTTETDSGKTAVLIHGSSSMTANNHAGIISIYDGVDALKIRLDGRTGLDSYINSGDFGIGTTDPQGALHVYSGGSARLLVSSDVHIKGATSLNFENANRAITTSTGDLRINPAGNLNLVTTSGNVGIGTTTPGAKLHVQGTISSEKAYDPLDDKLITYLPFPENTGTTTKDRSSSSKTGTFSGTVNWTTGKQGYGLELHGDADYLSGVPVASSFGNELTFSVWLYPDSVSGKNLAGQGSTWTQSIVMTNATTVTFNANPEYTAISLTDSIETGKWQLFTLTRDSSGNLKVYLNGRDVTSGSPTNVGNLGASHLFMSKTASPTTAWDGKVDEVRIWERVLSAGEVRDLYQRGLGTQSLYTDVSTGNVGIGTTGPSKKLQVGSATTDGTMSIRGDGAYLVIGDDTTNAEPYLEIGEDEGVWGVRQQWDHGVELDFWGLHSGAKDRIMSLNANDQSVNFAGNVGIGTTTPVTTPVTGKLTVSDATETHIVIQSTSDSQQGLLLKNAADGNSWLMSHRSDANRLGFYYHNGTGWTSELMTVLNGGNVGIGDTTPGYKLDVAGTGRFTDKLTLSSPDWNDHLSIVRGSDGGYLSADGNGLYVSVTGSKTLQVLPKVRIGSAGAASYTLHVDGTGYFTGALASTTLNTGQGANELYGMNQNVLTTSDPTFDQLNLTNLTRTTHGGVETFENVAHYYNGNTSTGIILITITSCPNIMLDAEITVQGYNGLGKYYVRGYTYAAQPAWHAPAAAYIGSGNKHAVRFATGGVGGNRYILIGTTTTNWGNYIHATVGKVSVGYGAGIGNWSISLVTSEAGLTNIVTPAINSGPTTFSGAMTVTGYLTKSGGGFMIDHPLDPKNKVLTHSFVESPDMKNLYDGVVVLDENGESTIELPDYFESLNRDFRYSVTPIGSPAMLFIKEEIRDNRFVVAGGEAGMKVSWQVTGTRKDAWAEKHRPAVEEDKGSRDGLVKKGEYIAKDCFEQ